MFKEYVVEKAPLSKKVALSAVTVCVNESVEVHTIVSPGNTRVVLPEIPVFQGRFTVPALAKHTHKRTHKKRERFLNIFVLRSRRRSSN